MHATHTLNSQHRVAVWRLPLTNRCQVQLTQADYADNHKGLVLHRRQDDVPGAAPSDAGMVNFQGGARQDQDQATDPFISTCKQVNSRAVEPPSDLHLGSRRSALGERAAI